MPVDPAFKAIPQGKPCFYIWRIENFKPVPVPRDQYGNFFEGDSYIILSISYHGDQAGMDVGVKENRGTLVQMVHFWLGADTSKDEAGTAAIKAVELDDHFGDALMQSREVQGHETKVFLNYFKKNGGIKYSPGGCASGFTHVEHVINNRLMHVKGKNTPRIRELPSISWASMNDGDAYILDIGEAFYVWNGKSCSRTERIKAMEYARKLRDDRGKGNIIVAEDGEEDQLHEDELAVFEEYLPLSEKSQLQPAHAGGADDTYERKAASNIKLWKCSEEGSQLKVTEIGEKPLKKQMLDTNDVFIVDNGEAGIWVWCGKGASKRERSEGMANALAFIQQRGYSDDVQCNKVVEMGEPAEFKALFQVWEKPKLPSSNTPYSQNRIARTVQTKFDASTMHDNPEIARETGMVDDGSGTKKIWRVERKGNTYEMVELEKKYMGQLYGGDSYVILYTYLVNGKENYIIYYWLGRKSTQDERGVAAKKTVEVDDSLGGAAKQVRVVHGKEPNHFLAMFGGKLIIFEGGKAGWGQTSDEGPGDTYLLHIRGTTIYNTKAEQVPCIAESLNSSDVFVLFSKTATYVWAGKGCTGDEREQAKNIASISPRGYTMMIEGQEKNEFWTLLGGKGEYSNSPRLMQMVSLDIPPPRLFQASNASGCFQVEEIVDFTQQDLVTDDVFILDAYDKVYVWVGEDSRPEEKTMAMDTAIEYVETDPSGRDEGTPIFMVKQGYEPPDFVGYFGVWDREQWSGGKSYEDLKKEMGEKNISMERVRAKSSSGESSFSDIAKYTYAQLTDKENPLEGIDVMAKEKHLSDEEFQSVFNMKYQDFVGLPTWKQKALKKDKQLF